MTVATLTKRIDEITESNEFKVSRMEKNLALEKLAFLEEQYQKAKTDKQPRVVRRLIGAHQLKENNTLGRALHQFNTLQNEIADLVEEREAILTEQDQESGKHVENTTDTLGNTFRTASYESGTKEWLEQRQPGLGGSDIGKILGLTNSPYEDKREILISKVTPITEKELAEQNVEGSAAARGNSWEEAILRQFAENHPEFVVGHCKDSFQSNSYDYQLANVDGLLKPVGTKNWNGILEIKTSTRPLDWENGIPLGYLAQGLWYLDAFGFDFGYVGVIIDSTEYREYYFDKNTRLPVPVKGMIEMMTIAETRPILEKFVAQADEARKLVAEGSTVEDALSSGRTVHRGTPKSVTEARIKQVNAFRQDNLADELGKKDTDRLMELYNTVDVSQWDKNFVVLDLETTRFSPRTGHIIELGATERNAQGEEVSRFDELYSVPAEIQDSHGTGAVNIHGIVPEDLVGKPEFAEDAEKILNMLKGKILIAHNATFEVMWLSQHVPGFIEADIQVVDTMHLSTILFPELEDSRLQTLCEALDVPYTNGHRAFHDAEVTAEAFFALMKRFEKDKNVA